MVKLTPLHFFASILQQILIEKKILTEEKKKLVQHVCNSQTGGVEPIILSLTKHFTEMHTLSVWRIGFHQNRCINGTNTAYEDSPVDAEKHDFDRLHDWSIIVEGFSTGYIIHGISHLFSLIWMFQIYLMWYSYMRFNQFYGKQEQLVPVSMISL